MEELTDEERLQFIKDLDESNANITGWEISFITSILNKPSPIFSDKQRDCLDKMIVKYDDQLRD